MATERLGVQELEARLAADSDGKFRDGLKRGFLSEADAIKRTLDAGVAPAEFQRLTRAREAYACAARVVDLLAARLKAS